MPTEKPLKKNPILDEIHKLATPLFNPAFSAEEWTEIWNECCEKVATTFEVEGLRTSAKAARGWKAKIKYLIIDNHIDGVCADHPEIMATSETEALEIHNKKTWGKTPVDTDRYIADVAAP